MSRRSSSSRATNPRRPRRAVKHAHLDELAVFADRDQSLVANHHADRSAHVAEQASRWLAVLAEEVAEVQQLAAGRASRGTTRLFLVAAAPRHADHLTSRLCGLASSVWCKEFEVCWQG